MAYSGEVLRRARERLAQARSEREAENAEHLRRAYRQVPRLAEIDRALRLTMAQAARTVFQQGGQAQAEFDRIRQENRALQAERERLIEDNFEEGFLDDAPVCAVCGGTGYVGSQMCECLRELCRQEQKKELTLLTGAARETFEGFQLSYYSDQPDPNLGVSPRAVMAGTLQTCRRYAQSFTLKSGNLLLNGNPGLGKTFLSAYIARAVADGGYSVVYETAVHLFQRLEEAKFSDSQEARHRAEKYTACDLLLIDDLGTELTTQFVSSALYTVLNDRLLAGRPTVVSTNLQSDEIALRYSPQIASRLLGSYRLVAFVGRDVRLQKAAGK